MITIFLNGDGWGWVEFAPEAKNIDKDFEWHLVRYDWIYETPMDVDDETAWFSKNWMVVPV